VIHFRMQAAVIFSIFLISFVAPSFCASAETHNIPTGQGRIGLDEILFVPSSFITAAEDDRMISVYLRTTTKEGDVPTDLNEMLDVAERVLAIRFARFGATFGWSGEENDELLEPRILAIDYKLPLRDEKGSAAFAVDFKFATKKIPGSTLRRSLLDFGVFSITGLVSKEMTPIFEPYGGVMANYIYVDASSAILTDIWKLVPFVGIRVNVGSYNTQIVSELNQGRVKRSEAPWWTWHLGVSVRF